MAVAAPGKEGLFGISHHTSELNSSGVTPSCRVGSAHLSALHGVSTRSRGVLTWWTEGTGGEGACSSGVLQGRRRACPVTSIHFIIPIGAAEATMSTTATGVNSALRSPLMSTVNM
ncbi:MAG: hypothetical protein ABIK79_16305 [Chloroflexota bacterium]|nr:hypothetical protein [Anaerolineae bacterium]